MISVLQIRETPKTLCAGIDANCQGLISLFKGDKEISVLPTINYTHHFIPFIRRGYLDKREIRKSIVDLNPDIIHIHGAYSFTLPIAVSCAKQFCLPIVLSPHYHPTYALRNPFLGDLFFNCIVRPILKDIAAVFTINNEDTEIFSRFHNNVIEVPHWSKFDKINPSGITRVKNRILFVGRINESNKGFEHLLYLPENVYEIHCVGKGTIPTNRKDFIHHENIDDHQLRDLMCSSSLLVVPSRYEAFSYVALEAMMCRTPILISDRVRIADYLCGVSGCTVFAYRNYGAFVESIPLALASTVDVNKLEQIFSPIDIRKKYHDEYIKVAAHVATNAEYNSFE